MNNELLLDNTEPNEMKVEKYQEAKVFPIDATVRKNLL